ncbi:MAG: hypothetical protein KDA80_07020 [Planctomycetaceae bacterium]|nr:hypothetical protein [Planctomycetaceae bacterium]
MKEFTGKVCLLTLWGMLFPTSLAVGQDAPPPSVRQEKPKSEVEWMDVKLRSSQQILEALTQGDTDHVATSARRMLIINLLEQRLRKDDFKHKSEYQGELNRFEFATKEIIRTAEADDIDGCLAAYQMLCASCVQCHKLIRDQAN